MHPGRAPTIRASWWWLVYAIYGNVQEKSGEGWFFQRRNICVLLEGPYLLIWSVRFRQKVLHWCKNGAGGASVVKDSCKCSTTPALQSPSEKIRRAAACLIPCTVPARLLHDLVCRCRMGCRARGGSNGVGGGGRERQPLPSPQRPFEPLLPNPCLYHLLHSGRQNLLVTSELRKF